MEEALDDLHVTAGDPSAAPVTLTASAYMQLRRVYTPAAVTCEAVARLPEVRGDTLTFTNPEETGNTDERSQIAFLPPGRVLFTTSQLAFRSQEQDVRLAFDRLGGTLEEGGAGMRRVAMSRFYVLSGYLGDMIREFRFDYLDKSHPPADTVVELEGLPSLDASFAVDVVAVPER